MLRAVLRRRMRDAVSGYQGESVYTLDFEEYRLEAELKRGGFGDRVRVKLGIHRGNYGTVRYVGGDDGTFYGVMLDTTVDEIGYFDDELEAA